MERLRARSERFAGTRATLIVVGVLAGVLGVTTYLGYTTQQLPTRNITIALCAMICVCGVGSAVVRPTVATRSSIGMALMVLAVARGIGLGIAARRASKDVVDFIGHSNPVVVWILVGYLGFLLWARAAQPVNRARREGGEDDS